MPFSTPMSLAIFFTTWFIVLFAVLPLGIRSQQESGDYLQGTDPGAPVAPRLWQKAALTTLLTAVVFVALVLIAKYM